MVVEALDADASKSFKEHVTIDILLLSDSVFFIPRTSEHKIDVF